MHEPRLPDAFLFDWDAGNQQKNWEKHAVTDNECEEIFGCRPLLVADDPGHSAKESRHLALGRTRTARRLFVSFTIRQGRVRVISARDMSRRERKSYEEAIAKDAKEEGRPELLQRGRRAEVLGDA